MGSGEDKDIGLPKLKGGHRVDEGVCSAWIELQWTSCGGETNREVFGRGQRLTRGVLGRKSRIVGKKKRKVLLLRCVERDVEGTTRIKVVQCAALISYYRRSDTKSGDVDNDPM